MTSPASQINQIFGLYKAEWLDGQLFELFTEPTYFSQLMTPRPCVLVGGRGTGKTTVLKGMSYTGQYAIGGASPDILDAWSFIGLYYRVNTNKTTAFCGSEIPNDLWVKYFGHYMNLELCSLLLEFTRWYGLHTKKQIQISGEDLEKVCTSLNIGMCKDLDELTKSLNKSRVQFESSLNNIVDNRPAGVSLQAVPVDYLTSALLKTEYLKDKQFFFLIDEFENFLDYQQQVLNTFIKHASSNYTFKIGVRELGWRERGTLNPNERMTHPADYALINIREGLDYDQFKIFASRVCEGRLAHVMKERTELPTNIEDIFPGLTEEEEALELGVEDINELTIKKIADSGQHALADWVKTLSPGMIYLLRYWSEGQRAPIVTLAFEMQNSPEMWRTRYGNYFHSALFTIRKGKRGIRKYYCGWDTIVRLADGNIRYLLELVHQSYVFHFQEDGSYTSAISPKNQTLAAQDVGRKNLTELEGISVEGGRLTKLLLSLGRIFQVMASTPGGHTPEITQFYFGEIEQDQNVETEQILNAAVMHQALVRSPGNKLLDELDTKEYDYRMHPIFCALFEFSYRQKRKMKITVEQFRQLYESPKEAIRQILGQNNREEIDLPEQLVLFEGFYHDHHQ